MTAHRNADTVGFAVVNARISDAERLAQAIDAVAHRGDVVRPLVCLVNAEAAARIGPCDGVELVGLPHVHPSDFRFLKAVTS